MSSDQARKSDIVDINMYLHGTSERAVLVSENGIRKDAIWLPLSQVDVEICAGNAVVVSMPEWLAIEKELV